MVQARTSFFRRHRWVMWLAGAMVVVLAALAVAAAIVARRFEPFLRAEIVSRLAQFFHARVELDAFHISLVRGVEAEGEGLRIWPPAEVGGVSVPATGETDPMISLDEFRFHAPLHFKPGHPVEIRRVELKGLKVHLPPRTGQQPVMPAGDARLDAVGAVRSAAVGATPAPGPPASQPGPSAKEWLSFKVDSIECTGAELALRTAKPDKLPLQFEIARIRVRDITPDGAMQFDAELTNPRPEGKIYTKGSFGPWQMGDPGSSPVSGDYRLEHADLASFKGIAGTLNSTGHYEGPLRELVVEGETDTPDFKLTQFGNPMALHTHFHARVDGTSGDTWLEPVDAVLGKSHLTAKGQVVHLAREADGRLRDGGHDIALTASMDNARIEDFLDLASKSGSSLLTGDLKLETTIHIPPGPAPVNERLELNGNFRLDQAVFTSEKIQDRIRELSVRGQGHPGEVKKTDADRVQSEMDGRFTLAGGVVNLPQVNYSVPGADIELKGTYALQGGALNFTGLAKMHATVSQMVGGWKGFLLKPADRFFKKDGAGTELGIRLGGTREKPDFGIDFGRMKSTSPERPEEKPQ